MSKTIDELKAKHKKIWEANRSSAAQLFSATGRAPEVSDARLNLFLDKLVEWGIVSEEQQVEFELQFESDFADALEKFWVELRNQQARQKLAVPSSSRQPKKRLILPGE